MGIQKRARRLALMVVCVCGGLALVGLTTAAGAFAVECEKTTGSGSTLQNSIQQSVWTLKANNATAFSTCAATPEVVYNANGAGTGSGQGLEEWGFQGTGAGALHPTLSANGAKLDGYVGTDDPPSVAEEASASKAGGTTIETVPVVDAPIAVILHPPAACKITGTPFAIPNLILDQLWLSTVSTWEALLKALKLTFTGTCTATIIHEVRSDPSGSSFAFKQYLFHIQEKPWVNFVKDAAEWPTETAAKTTHSGTEPNKGGKGEATAVAVTEGSVGYANLADAAGNGFSAYSTGASKFWARVQDNGTAEAGAAFAEPVAAANEFEKTPGNCPGKMPEFTGQVIPTKGEQPNWSGTQQAFPLVVAGTYPICTITYDAFWGKYTTTALKGMTDYNSLGEQVGNTMKRYCEFMVGTEGQTDVVSKLNFYSKLPEKVDNVAKETCKTFVAN